jgi:hypothetical protein
MPQMDIELYIEYIFWIFLMLVHLYSTYLVNAHFLRVNGRRFIINFFYSEVRWLKYEEKCIKNAFQKFCVKDKWVTLNKKSSYL